MKVPNTEALQAKVGEIEQYNEKARANATYQRLSDERGAVSSSANSLTGEIEELRGRKADMLEQASFPVQGLSFDEEGVLYNGIPFEQASGAERLRVSTAIGIALQPELKVLLIRDGSLLDDKNLEMLRLMAEEHNAQIWLERVGDNDNASVIIEDGLIREDRTQKKTIPVTFKNVNLVVHLSADEKFGQEKLEEAIATVHEMRKHFGDDALLENLN